MDGYILNSPAVKWQEGSLCGNGTLGAIVMGGASHEQIILNREDLFAPINGCEQPILMKDKLVQIRALIEEEKYAEAGSIPWELFREQYGEKLWTNPFIPACDVRIETRNSGIYTDYERRLDFRLGVSECSYHADGIPFTRKVFASRESEKIFIELSAGSGGDAAACVEYEISLEKHPYIEEEFFGSLKPELYDFLTARTVASGHAIRYICQYKDRSDGYLATLQILNPMENQCSVTGTRIVVKGIQKVLIAVSIEPSEDVAAVGRNGDKAVDTAIGSNGDKAAATAIGATAIPCGMHRERYGRIKLSLESRNQYASDWDLYMKVRESKRATPEFMHKIFNAGRYEILSSSGQMPPNLQGVWNGSYNIPWCSDYTQDGNLQTAIMGLLPCGDFESMQSYFRYQESKMEDYRMNSQRLYGCRGIHIPSRTSDSGFDVHFDETWPLLFWTAGAGWASRYFYDYWLYTGDDGFFQEHALPFMKEAALFYEDYLVEDEHGKWLFSPSYSPENTPAGRDSSVCANAAMDLAVAKELLTNLISGCRSLGLKQEQENTDRWEAMLEKMPPYLINEDGALKEWAAEGLYDQYDHRHASHLYPLFYDIPEEIRSDQRLYGACMKAYEIKMMRKKEEQGTMAFGLVQAGMVAAHLKDAEMVEAMLQSMACNNYYATFASAHDYGPSIFNADISGGLVALMLESVAQSMTVLNDKKEIDYYEVSLLPALPESMQSGQIEGLRLRGGLCLDMIWGQGRVLDYKITNPLGRKIKVRA